MAGDKGYTSSQRLATLSLDSSGGRTLDYINIPFLILTVVKLKNAVLNDARLLQRKTLTHKNIYSTFTPRRTLHRFYCRNNRRLIVF